MTEIRGVCADWLGICADAGKGKMKGSPNLLCSSDFLKKIMYLFLALPFVHGADCERIREVHRGFKILSEQKLNFIFFPICLYSARAKKGVWAFGCSEPGESTLHGQAK